MIKNYFFNQSTPFVGRKGELTNICQRLISSDCRLLTITGLGGSGKTRLAIEVAYAIASSFQHGAVFVGLQQITKSELLVHTIAQAIGLTYFGEGEPEVKLLNYLREKSLLLLLDNFEHLLPNTGLISAILTQAPGIKILVTSREMLNLQEEWLYPLKGMSIPLSAYATALEEYEAVQLFLYHARRTQPTFDLTHEQEAVIRICKMTAGLPLALELAASWLKGLTASQIAIELQHNLDFLATTSRNIEERHRSMRAVFDHSWNLLPENERTIFAKMSVFRGGFDSNAAEQVAEASLVTLAALVEKSLVQLETSQRFSIHELLRQYGMEKLEAYGEAEATYTAHSQYFANLMVLHETALQQPQQLEAMQAIESDFENIRLAWEWSAKNQQVTHLHMMINGLYLFGFLGSRFREIITLFQCTLEQPLPNELLLGRLLVRRWGYLHWWYQTDYQEALKSIQHALTIALVENNQFEIAFCHLMIAYVMISIDHYAEALPHLEMSKTFFEAVDEPYYVCWVMHRLGYVYFNLKQKDMGKEYTEQSLSLARVTHNQVALLICLYNLGSDYILEGDYVKAGYYGVEALQIATKSGHQCQIAHALSLLAIHAFCQGDYIACKEYAEHSQAIIEDINLLIFHPYSLALLIFLACLREDYTEGVRLSKLGNRHGTSKMDFQLQYCALATLACGLGNLAEARVYIQKLLQLSEYDRKLGLIIWMIPSVTCVLAEANQKKAVELLGWLFSYPNLMLQSVRQWPLFERLQAQLQTVLDIDSYQLYWENGKTLTLETVTSYLREEFGPSVDGLAEAFPQQLLTGRESEILHLLAVGLTNPQIAQELVISTGTVKTHTLSIYRKLDVANRTQAIVRAQELGLLSL